MRHATAPPSTNRLRLTRAVLFGLSAAMFGVSAIGAARAEAGDGATATGATVDRVGWWSERNVATETPAAVVTVPPPPGVPEDTIAVGAVNGEPDKLAAVGIVPDAGLGADVSAVTLTVAEADPPAGNIGAEAAAIKACPITEFWVAVENGTWETRPSFDCDAASAAGTRSPEGRWSFDLTPIAQLWLAEGSTLAPDGVVLVEDVDSPVAFQAVFDTTSQGAITLTFEAVPAPAPDDGFETADGDDFGAPDLASGGSIGLASPSLGLPGLGGEPVVPPAPPTTAAAGTEDVTTAAPDAVAISTSPVVLGNLPPAVIFLLAVLLATAGLMTYSLGPAGEPAIRTGQRGVSRALLAHSRSAPAALRQMEAR